MKREGAAVMPVEHIKQKFAIKGKEISTLHVEGYCSGYHHHICCLSSSKSSVICYNKIHFTSRDQRKQHTKII